MKEFKEWSEAIKYLQSQSNWSAALHNKMSGCRVFLDSVATLADEAPEDGIMMPNTARVTPHTLSQPYVTKANRDYYQAKCAVLLAANKASEKQYQEACDDAHRFAAELATAQQKIADYASEIQRLTDPVQGRLQKEQPKPPLTVEQFEALIGLIQSLSYEQTLPSPLMPDSHEEYYIARKALCGE